MLHMYLYSIATCNIKITTTKTIVLHINLVSFQHFFLLWVFLFLLKIRFGGMVPWTPLPDLPLEYPLSVDDQLHVHNGYHTILSTGVGRYTSQIRDSYMYMYIYTCSTLNKITQFWLVESSTIYPKLYSEGVPIKFPWKWRHFVECTINKKSHDFLVQFVNNRYSRFWKFWELSKSLVPINHKLYSRSCDFLYL